MHKFIKFSLFAVMMIFSTTAMANEADQAKEFVDNIGKAVISSFADKNQNSTQQEKVLADILTQKFAVRAISNFVLGKYSRNATSTQMDGFEAAFKKLVITLYTKQFNHYSGEKFEVKNAFTVGSGKRLLVTADILSKDKEPIRLSFLLGHRSDGLKILDVRVQGISMILTLRSEYTSFLNHNDGNLDKLINELRIRVVKLTSN